MATAEDLAEYDALFNAIDVSTSIDWCTYTCDMALTSIMYKAPNQCAATIIDPALDMFYLDSSVETYMSLCLYSTPFTFHLTALLLSLHSKLLFNC